jgi:hypothetical protein
MTVKWNPETPHARELGVYGVQIQRALERLDTLLQRPGEEDVLEAALIDEFEILARKAEALSGSVRSQIELLADRPEWTASTRAGGHRSARVLVVETLQELEQPLSPEFIVSHVWARRRIRLPRASFGWIQRDERATWKRWQRSGSEARRPLIVPALDCREPEEGTARDALLTLSTWIVEERLVVPATPAWLWSKLLARVATQRLGWGRSERQRLESQTSLRRRNPFDLILENLTADLDLALPLRELSVEDEAGREAWVETLRAAAARAARWMVDEYPSLREKSVLGELRSRRESELLWPVDLHSTVTLRAVSRAGLDRQAMQAVSGKIQLAMRPPLPAGTG